MNCDNSSKDGPVFPSICLTLNINLSIVNLDIFNNITKDFSCISLQTDEFQEMFLANGDYLNCE